MAVPLVLVMLPLGLLFLLSGLIVNTIQAILFVSIRPFSKNFYRRINRFLAELLWLQLVWVVDWWAGVKIQFHADEETYQSMGKEHALVISNHRSDIDWLIGWILAERSGCLGSTLAVMKKSSKFLPVIGWSMWFAEYLFLERSWAKDEETLTNWSLYCLEDRDCIILQSQRLWSTQGHHSDSTRCRREPLQASEESGVKSEVYYEELKSSPRKLKESTATSIR